MVNRVEKGLAVWHNRQQRYGEIFGEHALGSRAFAKIRLQEMRSLQRMCRPPKSMDERVSLKMLQAANRSLERRIYPNRLFRVGRRFFTGIVRGAGSLARGIAAMMQDNPAVQFDLPAHKKPEPGRQAQIKERPVETKPRVVRLQPRIHPRMPEMNSKSRGIQK